MVYEKNSFVFFYMMFQMYMVVSIFALSIENAKCYEQNQNYSGGVMLRIV